MLNLNREGTKRPVWITSDPPFSTGLMLKGKRKKIIYVYDRSLLKVFIQYKRQIKRFKFQKAFCVTVSIYVNDLYWTMETVSYISNTQSP